MSSKNPTTSLLLAGAAAAFGGWLVTGGTVKTSASGRQTLGTCGGAPPISEAPKRVTASETGMIPPSPGVDDRHRAPSAHDSGRGNPPSLPSVELAPEVRAARVEQKANHDLSRLVKVLDLDEAQQDTIFHLLARNSRYWSPEMQTTASDAGTFGKLSAITGWTVPGPPNGTLIADTRSVLPGNGVPPPKASGPDPAASLSPPPVASDNTPARDLLSEIMSQLTPEQQAALFEAESERAAWWAEILPQILPPDELPNRGNQEYEGSGTLE